MPMRSDWTFNGHHYTFECKNTCMGLPQFIFHRDGEKLTQSEWGWLMADDQKQDEKAA